MLVKVGDLTFGWGADARSLPENDAYGVYWMSPETEKALAKAIGDAGWVPSWRAQPTERVVYLCNPVAKWRQPISARGLKGQSLQVVQSAALPTRKAASAEVKDSTLAGPKKMLRIG